MTPDELLMFARSRSAVDNEASAGEASKLERWKTKQIQAAISRGVNPIDATRAMADFLASVPPGVSPIGYIRPAESLNQDLTGKAVADDLRAAWYGDENVPPRFKRLLDAKSAS